MKMFVTIAIICWLISGLAGSWMLEGNDMHLTTIARGPISLVKGFNDTPPQYPGQKKFSGKSAVRASIIEDLEPNGVVIRMSVRLPKLKIWHSADARGSTMLVLALRSLARGSQ